MKKITKTIENTIWGYDPTQFMPIWEDGQLQNKQAYVAYKLRRGARRALSVIP